MTDPLTLAITIGGAAGIGGLIGAAITAETAARHMQRQADQRAARAQQQRDQADADMQALRDQVHANIANSRAQISQ